MDLLISATGSGSVVPGIRRLGATAGLDTFTEIFEITIPRTISPDGAEGFLAAWTLQNTNIGRSEWFILDERLCSVRLPVIGYRNVTLEDAIAMGSIPENTVPGDVAQEDLARDVAAPGTVIVRVPCITGTKVVERSWPEWVSLASFEQALNAGETRLFKVVHRVR